jgi:UDP-2,3-diacylglucosamine pyrophosphatase LpxH
MRTSDLKIATVSDIHLGAKRTPTRDIIKNLKAAFPDNQETAELDMICLVGDVFDTLLSLNDEDLVEIDFWIAHLLRLCKKHDIVLYVLEGTPSHDWRQSERFVSINEIAGIGANLKYVKDISVEYEPALDIWVGFVPDESAPTTDQTLSQIYDLLRDKGLEQVDLMFMHGQFEYQLPPHVKAQKHDSEAYLRITRMGVFIGHVHIQSTYKWIYAQGSFDRLGHGEEEPKGHFRATFRPNGDRDVVFVENTGARKFITVYCMHMSVEDSLLEIERRVKNLPDNSAVRLEANHDHPLFADMDALMRIYPQFVWSKNPKDADEEEAPALEEGTVEFVPITITRENIVELLSERLVAMGVSADMIAIAQQKINEVR